jgi:N utilization substance protein B
MSHKARSVARLAAVQALYQMDVAGLGADSVVREFRDFRFDRDMDGATLAPADEVWFSNLVRDMAQAQARIDHTIARRLTATWTLARLDATVRAILRAAAAELLFRPDIPTAVVIDEYVEIAKSFFGGSEAPFINAALDAIAVAERPNG